MLFDYREIVVLLQRIHGEIVPFTSFPHAGLFITYLALFLMDGQGQPALLYLVPCTLGKYGRFP